MHPDFVSRLMNWIAELNLPEPEIQYAIDIDGQSFTFPIAYPEVELGVMLADETNYAKGMGAWRVWSCVSEDEVRDALIGIGYWLNPENIPFKEVKALAERGLHQEAMSLLEQITRHLGRRHPHSKEARELKQALKQAAEPITRDASSEFNIQVSFVTQLRQDAERIAGLSGNEFLYFGLSTPPEYEQLEAIDAVWTVKPEHTPSVWAATVQGHPTYDSDDTEWDIFSSEIELLEHLLRNIAGGILCVWDAKHTRSLLQRWHIRAIGKPLSRDIVFCDLRLLAVITSPTAKRLDSPISFCQEHKLPFEDEKGRGGVASAMAHIYQYCLHEFQQFDLALATLLYDLLKTAEAPVSILDRILPNRTDISPATVNYVATLKDHFRMLPPPIQESHGLRGTQVSINSNDVFKKNGYLERVVGQRYQVRQGQLQLASHIEETLRTRIPALYEAGTGVGKTKGYLVPLLLSSSRAFVATNTKNLQDQAWSKDVPEVLHALTKANLARRVSILKGKSNYFCPNILADALESPEGNLSTSDAQGLAILLRWAISTDTGWLTEIPVIDEFPIIRTYGRDYASAELVPDWATIDPHGRALEVARTADLIITNQSYVFALAQEQAESDIEVLLFDEAHNVENVATEALTLDFDPLHLYNELSSLLKLDEKGSVHGLLRAVLYHPNVDQTVILREFRTLILQSYDQLAKLNQLISKTLQRYADDDNIDFDPDYPLVLSLDEILNTNLRNKLNEVLQSLAEFETAIEKLLASSPSLGKIPKRLNGSLSRLRENVMSNRDALRSLLDADNNDRQVKWLEAVMLPTLEGQLSLFPITDNWKATFHSTPLDIAEWMHNTLPTLYPVRIFLSATLAVGSSFESVRNTLGMAKTEVTTALFPSPFDYRLQSLLCVPTTLPIPEVGGDDADYIEALAKHIASLAEIANGSTLVLFTSRKAMRSTLSRLQERLQPHSITVLMQSGGNRNAVAARFANSQATGEKLVLLGLRSFWEGVDFPGDILQIVVISRLPFDYSGHPVSNARQVLYMSRAFGADYFREVVIPQTLLHLKQMFGRLIRSETDRGVCIVADPRIQTRSYGPFLLTNIAESLRVVGPEESVIQAVQRFLEGQTPDEKLDWNIHTEKHTELSSEQLAVIETKARRVVVHAAAGSGKTRVLVERVIHIVQSSEFQARPEEVLALTYTNKAVDVMRERLNQHIPEKAFNMKVTTYHKLAMEIVRQQNREDGGEINTLNEDDPARQEIINLARQQAGISKRQLSDEEAESLVSYAQNVLVDEDELVQAIPQMGVELQKLAKFFLEFIRLLREHNLLTYSEIIVRAVQVLRTNEKARQQWSRKYRWIFCDEYQDTTPAQATLISLLGQYNHIFVVGDGAQSIYSWQGADPNNLRQFSSDYPNAATFRLSTNYRCFPRLVEGSDYFLSSTGQRYGGPIVSAPFRHKETQTIHVWASQDEYDEARSISKLIYGFFEASTPDNVTVGVLARKWSILLPLEIEFIRQEIPYEFYQTDSIAGFIGDEGIRRLIDEAKQLLQRATGQQLAGDTPEGQVIQNIRDGEISTAVELLESTKKARSIQVTDVKRYNTFLQILGDKPMQSLTRIYPSDQSQSKVVCSSIHGQKGEEFDLVFVIGLEDGHMPHNLNNTFSASDLAQWRRTTKALSRATARSELTDEDMRHMYDAEEQRLFYVALTRARYHLILCRCSVRDQTQLEPSSFLATLINSGHAKVENPEETSIETPRQIKVSQSTESDKHNFRTNNGDWVRSKSEKILADELHRRGVYYEYEAHLEMRVRALPDFTLLDYGGVVIEHLGMLDSPEYKAHWQSKKKRYDKYGVKYFTTTEVDIHNVTQSVEQLMQKISNWFIDKYGQESYRVIQIIEGLRRSSDFRIGRCIGELTSGIFEVLEHPRIVAICVLGRKDQPEIVLEHRHVRWVLNNDSGLPLWYAESD